MEVDERCVWRLTRREGLVIDGLGSEEGKEERGRKRKRKMVKFLALSVGGSAQLDEWIARESHSFRLVDAAAVSEQTKPDTRNNGAP